MNYVKWVFIGVLPLLLFIHVLRLNITLILKTKICYSVFDY